MTTTTTEPPDTTPPELDARLDPLGPMDPPPPHLHPLAEHRVAGILGERVVALCDVDRNHLGGALATLEQRGQDPTKVRTYSDFRRLLDAGFVDAHAAAGSGFSTSWPTNGVIPPFVRLDHALTTGGLVATDVEDFDVAGSDHLGMFVTVAPTRPATGGRS
mgnify:CR=1 FL=1